jgi:4-hydroxy-2-oxoheptanedioate aldolase
MAGRFGETPPDAHRVASIENTLVLGMIESPRAVAVAAEIIATPRLDGILVGPADLAIASGPDDPPLDIAIATVHAELARSTSLRMDIVGTREAAEKSFAAGADLVVYNLTSSLMQHLHHLVSPAR